MPQASDELRAMFPGQDQEAFEVIDPNFVVSKGGVIYPKVSGYQPTEREDYALDYLFDEWDYCYDPEGTDAKYSKVRIKSPVERAGYELLKDLGITLDLSAPSNKKAWDKFLTATGARW